MSSTKVTALKQTIFTCGVIVVSVAELAAGCTQTEDGAPAVSQPMASTPETSPASTNSPTHSPDNITTVPPQVPTATTSIASVVGALSEEATKLIDAAVDACADLYELRCAKSFWDVCIRVRIELGRMLELRSSMQVNEIIDIDELRSDLCSLFQIIQYWELYSILLAKYGENFYRFDTGFYSFRDQVENVGSSIYYSPWNLTIFSRNDECRDHGRNCNDGTFEYMKKNARFASYLNDNLRVKLLRFTYRMQRIFNELESFENNIVLMETAVVDRILGVFQSRVVDDQCYSFLLKDIFTNYDNGIFDSYSYGNVSYDLTNCISNLCDNEQERFFLGCYECSEEYREFFFDCEPQNMSSGISSNNNIAISNYGSIYDYTTGYSYSRRLLFWEVLKYACATGEIHPDAYANDVCRTVAHNVCRINKFEALDAAQISNVLRQASILDDTSFDDIEAAICDLAYALEELPYENAKIDCLSELEALLTNNSILSVSNASCNNATQRCLELLGQFSYSNCGGFEKYFHTEVFWKNISVLCAQDNSQSVRFENSECYSAIELFCENDLSTSLLSSEGYFSYTDEFQNKNIPFRERARINIALCDILLYYFTYTNANTSLNKKINLLPSLSQTSLRRIDTPNITEPAIMELEENNTQFTRMNFDLLNSASKACNNFTLSAIDYCVRKLWKSCFNLFYSKTQHESDKSEVYYSTRYVCAATWIAELAKLASVLASNFREDYAADNFNQYFEYIVKQSVGENRYFNLIKHPIVAIFSIDDDGTILPDIDTENLSPKVTESLTALATSLAQLIQPFIHLPTEAQQGNA